MRTTMTALVAVGVLMLGACGGDDDDAKGNDKKDDTSTDAGATDAGFCKDVVSLLNNTDAGSQAKAVAAARKLDAPKELEKDWKAWVDGIAAMDTTDPSFDPNDPEQASQYQEMSALTQKIFTYIQENCSAVDGFGSGSTTTTGQG